MLGMMPQNKKIASIILGGSKPSEDVEGPEVQEDSSVAVESVAEKILKAIETKDKMMLIEGLRDFMDIIEEKDEAQDMMEG